MVGFIIAVPGVTVISMRPVAGRPTQVFGIRAGLAAAAAVVSAGLTPLVQSRAADLTRRITTTFRRRQLL